MNLLQNLKPYALVLAVGVLQAQAVPVVFSGEIDLTSDSSGTYSIDFGIFDVGPESTIYSLYWDGVSLLDNSNNLTFLQSISATGWAFRFVHEVLTPNYSLDFSQVLDGQPTSVLSLTLNPPDASVTVVQESDTFLSVLNLNPLFSYSADIGATDPFVGSLTINPGAASAAPELDPQACCLPGLFALAALAAARRRPQKA